MAEVNGDNIAEKTDDEQGGSSGNGNQESGSESGGTDNTNPGGWDTSEIVPDGTTLGEGDDFPTPDDLEPGEEDERYTTWESSLRGVADAIRSVAGISNKLKWPYGYVQALAYIKAHSSGGQSGRCPRGVAEELFGYSTWRGLFQWSTSATLQQ